MTKVVTGPNFTLDDIENVIIRPRGGNPQSLAAAVSQPASSYVGPVATGCSLADTQVGGSIKQFMTRRAHYARDVIDGRAGNGVFTMTLQNFWNSELATGGTANFTASIEYPAGTFTRVLWNGAIATGVVPDLSVVTSDSIPVSIPKGALFWSRIWANFNASNGAPLIARPSNSVLGEGYVFSGTTTPDLTLGGAIAAGSAQFAPIALFGTTSRPTIGLVGDSRVIGAGDTPDISGNLGTLARLVGDEFGYINVAAGGSTTQAYVNVHTIRNALLANCSHIVVAYGVNDVSTSVPLSTTQANLGTIGGYFSPAQPVVLCTIMGETSSTDSWATENNQTVTVNTTPLNNWIRECPSPFWKISDLSRTEEVPFGTGKFFVNGLGTVALPAGERPTTDGTHETRYLLVGRMVALNPLPASWFTR